ncbi:phosphatidate cytidylyltransferase [Stappia sp. F7233]|uniref:Phosphatidate cytidylyltransferase n=1 Tax=Stappia albiluteola TaxID=2758565 RepID=A0A839ABH0_9HYPH|nr:phosphatidate cytidylyltransferase [Stappia albiluteola]MBA5776526.1 phosphatidate cytidylyltransferase [Stappia albiluteola]
MSGEAGAGLPDGSPAGGMSNLRLRVLSALVLGPLALAAIWFGGVAFAAFVGVTTILLLHEWLTIVGANRLKADTAIAYAAAFAALLAVAFGEVGIAFALVLAGGAATFLFGLRSDGGRWVAEGVLYAGLTGVTLIALRDGEYGLVSVAYLFLLVWATDIAAYFVGRSLGGPKLWPRVSPKKTWSGATGGAAAAMLIGLAGGLSAGSFGLAAWLAASVILSIFSQVGDLFESAVKRHFGVKDSGRIIPGHGGVMDRVDGIVGAAVLGYALASLVTGSISDPVAGLVEAYAR